MIRIMNLSFLQVRYWLRKWWRKFDEKCSTRPEFLFTIIKTGYKLIEPFILCKASLTFCATRSHVTRLKSACVRVSLEARNRPMRSERKIANGTWQRFFFRDKRSHSCQQRANDFRATNKQALTTNNKSCWTLVEENLQGSLSR